MAYAIQYTRSLCFLIQMYLMMVVFGLLFCPLVSLNRKYSYLAVHVWCTKHEQLNICLLYTSPSPRDRTRSRMPSSA